MIIIFYLKIRKEFKKRNLDYRKSFLLPTSSNELAFNVFDVSNDVSEIDAESSFLLFVCESKYCTEKFFI